MLLMVISNDTRRYDSAYYTGVKKIMTEGNFPNAKFKIKCPKIVEI